MKVKNQKANLFASTRFKLDAIASVFVFFILFVFSYTVYRLLTLDIIYQISPVFKNTGVADYINADKLFSNFREQTVFLLIVSDIVVFILSIFFFDRIVKKMLAPIEYLSNVQKKFAENVSHELRTPLSIMNMHGEILGDKIDNEVKSAQDNKFLHDTKTGVNAILSEIKDITNIIDDLLFEARIKYSESAIENLSLATVKSILEKVIKNLSHNKSQDVNLVTEFKLKDLSKLINVNKLHLERIFNNLISNSIKYTNTGEIKISLETYKYRTKENLRLIISDTGVGIIKKDLNKVSERFFRGGNVEGEVSGTGIGLSIVKDLVKDYGWDFKINSEENIGTKVEINKINII